MSGIESAHLLAVQDIQLLGGLNHALGSDVHVRSFLSPNAFSPKKHIYDIRPYHNNLESGQAAALTIIGLSCIDSRFVPAALWCVNYLAQGSDRVVDLIDLPMTHDQLRHDQVGLITYAGGAVQPIDRRPMMQEVLLHVAQTCPNLRRLPLFAHSGVCAKVRVDMCEGEVLTTRLTEQDINLLRYLYGASADIDLEALATRQLMAESIAEMVPQPLTNLVEPYIISPSSDNTRVFVRRVQLAQNLSAKEVSGDGFSIFLYEGREVRLNLTHSLQSSRID
jgi:hypothetical protein